VTTPLPDLERIAAAFNRQLPAATEDFDLELVALAVEDDLADDYDRAEMTAWTIEGAPFHVWLRRHLTSLRRRGRVQVARDPARALAAALAAAKRKRGLALTPEETTLADAADEKAERPLPRTGR